MNRARFGGTNGYRADDNGLLLLGHRYYDAKYGRFITKDPIGLAGGDLNLYNYCGGNPLTGIDPSGLVLESGGDILFLTGDVLMFAQDPSWSNAGWMAADLVAAAVPFLPSTGYFRYGAKFAHAALKSKRLRTAYKVARGSRLAGKIFRTGHGSGVASCAKSSGTVVKISDAGTAITSGVPYMKSSLGLGQNVHKGYRAVEADLKLGRIKEFRGIPGIRPDFVDIPAKTVYELKPYNPRGLESGPSQLNTYKSLLEQRFGGTWNTVLDVYHE